MFRFCVWELPKCHPSPHHPTWFSLFRLDMGNSFESPVILKGLRGQRFHSTSVRLSLCWSLQYSHEKESLLYKGKQKSPWPAFVLGKLHKSCIHWWAWVWGSWDKLHQIIYKNKAPRMPKRTLSLIPKVSALLPRQSLFIPADLRPLGGHREDRAQTA